MIQQQIYSMASSSENRTSLFDILEQARDRVAIGDHTSLSLPHIHKVGNNREQNIYHHNGHSVASQNDDKQKLRFPNGGIPSFYLQERENIDSTGLRQPNLSPVERSGDINSLLKPSPELMVWIRRFELELLEFKKNMQSCNTDHDKNMQSFKKLLSDWSEHFSETQDETKRELCRKTDMITEEIENVRRLIKSVRDLLDSTDGNYCTLKEQLSNLQGQITTYNLRLQTIETNQLNITRVLQQLLGKVNGLQDISEDNSKLLMKMREKEDLIHAKYESLYQQQSLMIRMEQQKNAGLSAVSTLSRTNLPLSSTKRLHDDLNTESLEQGNISKRILYDGSSDAYCSSVINSEI